jgi:hypothetical protein
MRHRGERAGAKRSTTKSVLLTSAAILLMASAAQAQVGPSTLSMTCAQAAALVASRGAVVLSTGATTYDRFVQHSGFCVYGDREDLAWIATRDLPQCPLKVCRSANRWSTR